MARPTFKTNDQPHSGRPVFKKEPVYNDEATTGYETAEPLNLDSAKNTIERFGRGFLDPVVGIGQIVGQRVFDPDGNDIGSVDDVRRSMDSTIKPAEGIDVARMVGNVANPVSWLAGPARLPMALRMATVGGVQGAVTPTVTNRPIEERITNTVTSAVAAPLVSRILRGFTPTAEAQRLIDQGIQPSLGQSLGSKSVFNKLEQQAQSIPLLGGGIERARQRPLEEWERTYLSRVVDSEKFPVGDAVQTLDDANKFVGGQYNQSVGNMRANGTSQSNVVQSILDSSNNVMLDSKGADTLNKIYQQYFSNPNKLKAMSGEELKKLDSELGYMARRYAGGSPSDQALADEITNMRNNYRAGFFPHDPADYVSGPLLDQANKGYYNLVPANQAASSRMDNRIMPRALQKAVAKQRGTSSSRMYGSTDPEVMLINDAVSVLPNTVADSGTAGRGMLGAGVVGGATGAGVMSPVLALGSGGLVYGNRGVQQFLTGGLTPYSDDFARVAMAALRGEEVE